jgi:alpha,alpha-trehalase
MEIYELGQLFEEVQMKNILSDGKTFPDCFPKYSLDDILEKYQQAKEKKGFKLLDFVNQNFDLPTNKGADFQSDTKKSINAHIESLWNVLTREPDKGQSSLIPLPHPYIVPGGRFREIYYWDSYFTMLGLQVSKRVDLIENMVNNFAFLINTIGHIPNGNRTYYVGRSQPPFFAMMVKLLSEERGAATLVKYLPELEKEYIFWMQGSRILRGRKFDEKTKLLSQKTNTQRVVRMPNGTILNRYWDKNKTPRPESYKEDVQTARYAMQDPEVLFRHIRAAAESGWDFSTRWFKDPENIETIHTTDIIPVDLNCLLMNLENTLAEAYQLVEGKEEKVTFYQNASKARRDAILKYCWDNDKGFFFDYDFVANKQKEEMTAAALYPLFFKIATEEQAEKMAITIADRFIDRGGLVTTLYDSGQQWDAPNGWAPLQWIAFKGLRNYDFVSLANKIKRNWLTANKEIYQKTGKMTEKYNVAEYDLEAGGGEYPLQDGFGWTNGVYLALDAAK